MAQDKICKNVDEDGYCAYSDLPVGTCAGDKWPAPKGRTSGDCE